VNTKLTKEDVESALAYARIWWLPTEVIPLVGA